MKTQHSSANPSVYEASSSCWWSPVGSRHMPLHASRHTPIHASHHMHPHIHIRVRGLMLPLAVALGIGLVACLAAGRASAQMAVIDTANLVNSKTAHAEDIAKYIESISHLKTQISHLKEQIAIQDELRNWAGDPIKAASLLGLESLHVGDLTKLYGESRDAVAKSTNSLAALKGDASGTFRALDLRDMNGQEIQPDESLYRRHSVLQARQNNAQKVADETRKREQALQADIAETTAALRSSTTDAEVQKLNAKIQTLNGQLAKTEAARKREVDEVTLQKVDNDTQREVEEAAAAELRAKDDHLANQKATQFLQTLIPRRSSADAASSSSSR